MKPDTPAHRLVKKFGGLTAAAAALRYPKSTVQRWDESGYVHPRHHPRILSAAAARKIILELSDFISIDLTHPAFGAREPKRERARSNL